LLNVAKLCKMLSKKNELDNERYTLRQNLPSTSTQSILAITKESSNVRLHKYDICSKIYSSNSNLDRHKRTHILRGETKENYGSTSTQSIITTQKSSNV